MSLSSGERSGGWRTPQGPGSPGLCSALPLCLAWDVANPEIGSVRVIREGEGIGRP